MGFILKRYANEAKVKQQVLNSSGISSRQIAARSGLDIRTVRAYAAELCRQGLAVVKLAPSRFKGRPATRYYPNVEHLTFLGLLVRPSILSSVLIDSSGQAKQSDSQPIDAKNESKRSIISKIFNCINRCRAKQPGVIGGIGISLSRHLLPPLLATGSASDIPNVVEREFRIPVFSDIPVNVATFIFRERYPGEKNIMVVNPGVLVELGVMQNGVIIEKTRNHEYDFCHTSVDPNGERCYCGNRGCLENFVSLGALSEALRSHKGHGSEVIIRAGECLGRALAGLVPKFHPGLIVVLPARGKSPELEADLVRAAFRKALGGMANVKLEFCRLTHADAARAAADMAAFLTVRNYIS